MRTSTSNKTSKKTNKWMSESAHSVNIVNISLDNTNQSRSIKNVLRHPSMIVCLIITYSSIMKKSITPLPPPSLPKSIVILFMIIITIKRVLTIYIQTIPLSIKIYCKGLETIEEIS